MKDKPQLPKISFSQAARYKRRLYSRFCGRDLKGRSLMGEAFETAVSAAVEATELGRSQLFSCLSAYVGQDITDKLLVDIASFISVNYSLISAGVTVIPTKEESFQEAWCPVVIDSIESVTTGEAPKARVTMRVVWGPWLGLKAFRDVDVCGAVMAVLMRKAGVTSSRKRVAMPKELVGMYLYSKLKLSYDRTITFGELAVHPYLLAQNKTVLKERKLKFRQSITSMLKKEEMHASVGNTG